MKKHKIKYDAKDKKSYFFAAASATILFALGQLLIWLLPEITRESDAFIVCLLLLITCFLPVISAGLWLLFWDSALYLKRLEQYGFPLPESKKDFGNDLEQLACSEGSRYGMQTPVEATRDGAVDVIVNATEDATVDGIPAECKESKILAFLSWGIFLAMVGFTIYYFIRFSHVWENVGFLGYVSIFIALAWGFFGAGYYRQKNPEKYRDDVDFKSPKKERKQLVEGVVTIIFLAGITLFAACNIYSMSKYVERSVEAREAEYSEDDLGMENSDETQEM
ncbi:MAG: hypothetical protein E7285_00890 [Lachnospiraceae bacterium]|nr:hypothetical protein [Lachnospiraceae bacterium]